MDRYRIASTAIVHELLGDEVIIANLDSGIYYSIRHSGAIIWQLVIAGYSLEAIEKQFSEKFPQVDSSFIRTELFQFVNSLVQEKLIKFTSETTIVSVDISWTNTFEKPFLSSYGDMRELLLLDPIHEVDEQGWPNAK